MDKSLDTLERMLELADTKSTMEEFLLAFDTAIEVFKAMKEDNKTERAGIRTLAAELFTKAVTQAEAHFTKASTTQLKHLRAQVALLKGKDGHDGIDGRDGKDGPQGLPGDPGASIKGDDGQPGKDGSPDTPDEIVDKVNSSSKSIKEEKVEGLADIRRMATANSNASGVGVTTTVFFKNGTQVGRAKNINIIEGNNITATMYQIGDQMNINITSTATSAGSFATEEVPVGLINNSNVTFTLAHTPTAGSVKLFLNGARQQSGGGDYTISGSTITFVTAPMTGSILFADYQY